jgi:hypothetical protein
MTAGRAEAAIEKALASPTTIEFSEAPLRELVAYLQDYHKIEVRLDTKAMEEIGVASDAKITANLKGMSLRSALDLVLRPLGLGFTIYDEVLLITSPDEIDNSCLIVKVYDVADLVTCRNEKGQPWDDYDSLIDLITSQIHPATWDAVGGPAAITGETFGSAKVIVVTHRSEVQRQIAQLLARIRAIGAKSPGDGKPPTRSRQHADPSERGKPKTDKAGTTPKT